MTGTLKSFVPNEPGARALCEAGQQYYNWVLASSVASKDGESQKATPSDWMDLIGSAGMVMGAIKKRDGDQKKFVITMQNSSPHVVVPFKVTLPADKFYAKSNLFLMTPGDSSEAEFDVNSKFSYTSMNPCDFYVNFTVVASNGKSTNCYLHFEAKSGGYFKASVFYAYGHSVKYPPSDRESEKEFPENFVAAAEGDDDYPSFAISMLKVVIDPEESGTSKIGIVIAPWKIGTVAPSAGYFTFPTSGQYKPTLYGDLAEGARDVGLMAWNYLKRCSDGSMVTLGADAKSGVRGVGGVASFVTMGVNLIMGARNLNRKDNGCHNLVLTIKNMTSHTVTTSHVERAEGCYADNTFIPPHGEGTVHLGTKNFAGGSADNDNGPGAVFTVSDGAATTSFQVGFGDTTHSGFSGQIRVRHIIQNGYWCHDNDGYNLNCMHLNSSFYKSMANGMPEFLIMLAPISKGEADLTLVLIN